MNIARVIFSLTNSPVLLGYRNFLLLLLLIPLPSSRSLAGCDGFGGTGGSCGTGGDVIHYTVTDGLVTITSVSGFNGQELVIPTNGLPVVSIGPYAFYESGVTNVIIPNTVTNIGSSAHSAFYNCHQLAAITVSPLNPTFSSLDGVLFNKSQSVLVAFPQGKAGNYSIPASVTLIKDEAFSDNKRLINVTIPNSVTSIGNRTFYFCPSLTNISLGNRLTNIGEEAFNGCYRLINPTLPNTLRSIGAMAFRGCASLTTISLPTGLTNIGYSAFSSCGLTAVTIPGSVKVIQSGSFESCDDLASLVIRNGVTHIGSLAFYGCGVTNVTFPNSIEWIEYRSFGWCPNLATVTLGRNVTTLEGGGFDGSRKLAAINVDPLNPTFSSLDGVLFNRNRTLLLQFPFGRVGNYTVPETVTSIGHFAFESCGSLTTVTIPNAVTNIGNAFYACTSLTNLTFLGNAPSLFSSFSVAAGAQVYYYHGAAGWEATYGGLPTVMLYPPPQVVTGSADVNPGEFGFMLNGVVNQTIVVEASINLVNWQPIWTRTLSTLSTNFVDPDWVNHPNRFYRLQSN